MNKVYLDQEKSKKVSWYDPVHCFVGLLKNVQSATDEDIKLYLSDHKKIATKMAKAVLKAKTMKSEFVEGHLASLNACQDKFKEATTSIQGGLTDGHVHPIIEWSITFAEFCLKTLRATEV